jgi:ribosome-binding protein aMBF1 (putative translation factor)
MITGPLCKAARALVQVSRSTLAARSNIRKDVIEMFERSVHTPDDSTRAILKITLEELGAVFICDEGANGAAFA